MRHPAPSDLPPRIARRDTRIATLTALGALVATALLGIAAPQFAGHVQADAQTTAPRPLSRPAVPAVAPPAPDGRGDDSVPLSSEVFSLPRSAAGIEGHPSTF